MLNDTVEADPADGESRQHSRQPWVIVLGAILVFSLLPLLHESLSLLVPKVPGRPQQAGARLRWYCQSGQLRADARTLAAAFRFVREHDFYDMQSNNASGLPVASQDEANLPKS
jgi:hypothetical protein